MPGEVPVAELHVHLEGTLSPAMVGRLAARNSASGDLPPLDWLTAGHRWTDAKRWLSIMRRVGDACLRVPQDYADAMRDYVERLEADGVVYAEISLSLARTARGSRDDQAILAAVCAVAEEAPLPVGVIVGLDHQVAPDEALVQLDRALELGAPALVGIDLHGLPGQRSTVLAETFERARRSGLGTRVHAGELQGPRSVWDALELGVDRIAHGVRAIEDAALVERLSRSAVTLDICPASNLALCLYDDMAGHPLRQLFDAGVRVTLGSDDPLYFNATARGEYERAAQHGFTRAELMHVSRTAIEASFAPHELRERLLADLTHVRDAVPAEQP